MYSLLAPTPVGWLNAVMDDFDAFLLDHAACERKASGMAVSMVCHYPDKPELVECLTDLAIEEMHHFREVVKLIHARQRHLVADTKDEYVNRLRAAVRTDKTGYFMDRLVLGSIIEKRGAERFGLIADALPEGELKTFYAAITRSESRHFESFIDLAAIYFDRSMVMDRVAELLPIEADIITSLPFRPALH